MYLSYDYMSILFGLQPASQPCRVPGWRVRSALPSNNLRHIGISACPFHPEVVLAFGEMFMYDYLTYISFD